MRTRTPDSVDQIGDASDRVSPVSNEGEVTARIEGELWRATASIQVTLHGGILAVAGFDTRGLGIGLAFLAGPVEVPQLIGPTPANGMVTVGARTWLANGRRGSGAVTLLELTSERAVGTFSFVAETLVGNGPRSLRQVTDGRFDVRL